MSVKETGRKVKEDSFNMSKTLCVKLILKTTIRVRQQGKKSRVTGNKRVTKHREEYR